jgi:hypothetical protein
VRKPRRPTPMRPERVRRITGSFGWIDHRFVRDGFLEGLHPTEALLYCFLAVVADSRGMSYYREDTIRYLLRIPFPHSLKGAISELVDRDMIAYRNGVFQVLSLPAQPVQGGS